eukprot:gene4430-5022_t
MPEQNEPEDNCHENKELKENNSEHFRVDEENSSKDNVENGPVQDNGNQVQGDQSATTLYKTRSGRSVKPNR